MFAASLRLRVARFAILAVSGATALSVAACGTSHNENVQKPTASARPTTSAPTSPPSAPIPAEGKDHVEGLIRSVSGNVVELTQRNRTPATVDFTSSTRVIETTPAQLTDVTAGSCVDVEPTREGAPTGGAISAQSVTISPAVDGKCPPPTPPAPGSAGTPPPPPAAPAAPAENPGVYGTVAFVSGNMIAVTSAGGNATQDVTVTDTTSYTKQTPATTQAITQGKCMAAQGTTDNRGVLQATTIDLEPCPPLGRPHHHFPHLPHHHGG
jgi:hypothetical protein